MTKDNLETQMLYRQFYFGYPSDTIIIHLDVIDFKVDTMQADDLIEARILMDQKIPLWK
jgi:hypothetical protein